MKSLIAKIYTYRIFSEFILLYPLYNVMFAERGQLSTLEISTLLGVWSVIILLFEIPSGALADKYSRRNLLGIAQLLRAVGFGVWIVMPDYVGFLIGLVLWGVSRSLTSGTFEALLFDELKAEGKEKSYIKIIGRGESLALFFGLGATLLAAPVFAWTGYAGVLWFSIGATLIAAVIAFTLPNQKQQNEIESPHYLRILQDAAREVRHNPALIKLILFGVFAGMLFRVFDEYASLILRDASVVTALIPVISTLVFLPVIIADFFAYKLEKMRQITFMALIMIAGLALMLTGRYLGYPGIVAFAGFMLLVKVSMTVFGAKVQHAIQGKTRATILSVNGFGIEVAAVGGFLLYGALVQSLGTSRALTILGVIVFAVGFLYIAITRGRLVVTKRQRSYRQS